MHHRLLQTPEGRYYIGVNSEDREIPFTFKDNLQVQLSELPSLYAERHISDASPSNSLLPDFIPQLHTNLLLAGKEPFFHLQLTHVQDGYVLGFSFFHGLAGQSLSNCHLKYALSLVMNSSTNLLHSIHCKHVKLGKRVCNHPASKQDLAAFVAQSETPVAAWSQSCTTSCAGSDRGRYSSRLANLLWHGHTKWQPLSKFGSLSC